MLTVMTAALLAAAPPAGPPAGPLVLYRGASFRTLDPAQPLAQAVLVEGTRVRATFAQDPAQGIPGAQVVDLGGGFVVPGLHDAHLHLAGVGEVLDWVDLHGCRSAEEAAARVKAALVNGAQGWVRGRGWDQNAWACGTPGASPACGGAMPTRGLLDAVAPGVPVALTRVDGHALWVNSQALRHARAAGTPHLRPGGGDPPGGRVLRDGKGEPTGVLVDTAMDLVTARLPAPTDGDVRRFLLRATARAAEAGLTSVHDMAVGEVELRVLETLDREGLLPVRVFAYLDGTREGFLSRLPPAPARSPSRLEVRGVKFFADGALGSRGAALLAPYSDEPGHRGLLVTEPKTLEERARAVHQRGFQVATHAIGDRANREVLGLYARLGPGAAARRHRVEHAQVVSPQDLPGFAATGAVASVQPVHATSDMGWALARLGPERLHGAYAWRSLATAGAVLALGSDAPVESLRPLWGLFAARTRTDHAGQPPGGWRFPEALDAEAALRGYTTGPAHAVAREDELGTLRPGALADFTWLDVDPVACAAPDLVRARVRGTAVDGRLRRAP
jgi:hypothetical protein